MVLLVYNISSCYVQLLNLIVDNIGNYDNKMLITMIPFISTISVITVKLLNTLRAAFY